MPSGLRQVPTQNIGIAGDGIIRLVYRISPKNDGIAANARLRVDDGIAAQDRSAAPHHAAYSQVAEQDNRMPGQVAFHLHRTEDAGRVMHLLAGSDVDVLPYVSTIPGLLRARDGGSTRQAEQGKRKNESTKRAGQQCSPKIQRDYLRCYAEGDGLVP